MSSLIIITIPFYEIVLNGGLMKGIIEILDLFKIFLALTFLEVVLILLFLSMRLHQ